MPYIPIKNSLLWCSNKTTVWHADWLINLRLSKQWY